MRGLMMDYPLLISSLIEYAAEYHGSTEIVSRTHDHALHRYDYREAEERSRRLAKGLVRLGVGPGDRIATLAWNDYRHFEIYYATSGMGAVCHTLNPRLFPEQLVYIINHAEDSWITVDPMFLPLVAALADKLPTVRGYIVLSDAEHMPETSLPGEVICYEELVTGEDVDYAWPRFDENTASSLCYTSGTTGHPKGVLYSHRSTVLHAFGLCMPNAIPIGVRDAVLPVVPMFHANAWGIPYAAPMSGSKLVMPGPKLDGESVYELLAGEKVTMTAGVPTVWLMLLQFLQQSGKSLPDLEHVVIGGSAAPRAMIEAFQQKVGVTVIHAWGMTETSPLGTVGTLLRKHDDLSEEQKVDVQVKQGRGIWGVDMKIVGDDGREMPRDGKSFGELLVRGPWVVGSYYKSSEDETLRDGWFPTGDVATLDEDGFMQITDRSKDVIKSGGEWISSIELENAAIGHEAIAEAAVIGVSHPKWGERPLLVVVPVKGATPKREEIVAWLKGRVADWWLPDDVAVVDELPHTAAGKISKKTLRERFADYRLPAWKSAD
jgi:fatty-acyl-CoA synthase